MQKNRGKIPNIMFKSKLKFLLLFLIFLVTFEIFVLVNYQVNYEVDFNAVKVLESFRSSDKSIYELVGKELDRLTTQGKISEALELSKVAIENKDLDMSQCHNLLHLVGHKAYSLFGNDFKRLLFDDKTVICGRPFHHGIEAEITLVSNDVKKDLYAFCNALTNRWPGLSCFHGAGHEFMNISKDIQGSLAKCDDLISDIYNDPSDCYRGVFSQYAFEIQGIDGDTGLPIAGGPVIKLQESHPLAFCQKLPDKYQFDCGSQLSRISINWEGIDKSIQQCINGDYQINLKSACIRNISAIFAQREFSQGNVITVPLIYFSLPEELRHAFISGMAQEFDAFANTGIKKDAKSVCELFRTSEDQQFCLKLTQKTFILQS